MIWGDKYDVAKPPPIVYDKAEERLRLLVASGRYKIIKRFQREDQRWPWVYLLVSSDAQNTLHLFTRQRIG